MNRRHRLGPPRLAAWILAAAIGDEVAREGLAGDLAEEYDERHDGGLGFRARAWYWSSALRLSARYLWERARSDVGSSRRPPSSDRYRPPPHRGDSVVQTFWQDIRFAIRTLGKSYGFTAVAVLTLAIGVGATTAVFSTLDAVLLTPLPYEEPEHLVIANTTFDGNVNSTSSAQDYEDYRAQSDAFEFFALMAGFPMSVVATSGAEAHMSDSLWISWDLFRALRVAPALGRGFRADEAELDAANVAIVSHAYWQARLGGTAEAIGSTVVLDGTPATVVGVMPAGFRFYHDVDVWLPYRLDGPFAGGRQYHNWVPIGRLREGATLEQAQTQFDVISARLQTQYPETNEDKAMLLTGLHESMTYGARPSMMMLAAAVALLLLIACANVANLLLAKGTSRQSELAVRAALGAGRGRLVRQLLTESLVIAILAGLVGTVSALWLQEFVLQVVLLPALGAASPGVSWGTLGFALTASITTSLLFGMVPALQTAPRNLSGELRAGRRAGASVGGTRLRSGLVVAQVALSFVLLVGAGLLVRSFASLAAVDGGFNSANLLTAEVRLPPSEYEPEQRAQFFSRLAEAVGALPGVTGVAIINQLPVRDPGNNIYIHDARNPPADLGMSLTANTRIVLPGYFETMEIPLLAGRTILDRDTAGSPRVMVINKTMADTLFPGDDPVGQRVVIAGGTPATFEVVGVVGDVLMSGPADARRMGMYRPYSQSRLSTMRMAVRTGSNPAVVAASVRRAIRALDPNIPTGDLETMESIIAGSGTIVQSRVAARSLGLFAVVALLLASVGLYGVLAFSVSQRQHEIGVRMALGAKAGRVTGLIVKEGLALVALGLVIGAITAFAGMRVLADQLFQVGETDPATYLVASVIFLLVAVLACVVPVARALRVDPLIALRTE